MRNGVLVTRPIDAARNIAERLRAAGWQPVLAPLLRIKPMPLGPKAAPGVAAVVLTSANAVPAIPEQLRHLPALAVGDATAKLAREHGCGNVLSAGGDAAALARLAAARLDRPGPLLLLAGQGQGAALAAKLRGLGFRVHRRIAYAARPESRFPAAAAEAIEAGALRAALFLSAETARTFVRLLPPRLQPALEEVDALAIGAPAAAVLRPLPWRRVLVSGAPTLDGILGLL